MPKQASRIVKGVKKAARRLEFGSAISPSVPKQEYERPKRGSKARKTHS